MGTLLLILQIIGAIPQVIAFLRMLWDYIRIIRNRDERNKAKKKFRALVFRRQHLRKMSAQQNEDLLTEARSLYNEVQAILNEEGKL